MRGIVNLIQDFDASYRRDFKKYYAPSDNLWGNPTGQDQGRGFHLLQDYEMLMDKRVGWGHYVTRGLAATAVRNTLDFMDIKKSKAVENEETDKIQQWMLETNFLNQFEDCLAYERGYGTGFLVLYWSKKDDFTKAPPNTPPNSFDAFSPLTLFPTNITETGKLDYDTDLWDFGGGKFNFKGKIHRDRVFVLCTRELPYDWLGRSVFDPIWLSAMAYLQIIQGLVKGISKWGNMIPVFTMQDEYPTKKKYKEYLELVETFRQNYTFILAQGETVTFEETDLGAGIEKFAEFVKEDIASGTEMSLNKLFGRAVSGGIGGEGSLTAERSDLQTIANIQHDVSYPMWKLFKRWFKVDYLRPQFKLELQKTREAQIAEDMAEEQLLMLKEQTKIIKMQRRMLSDQMKLGLHVNEPNEELAGGEGNEPNQNKDFTSLSTVLPRLTFNTQITIKNKKRDNFVLHSNERF